MLNLLFLYSLFLHPILAVYQIGKSLLTPSSCLPRDQSKCTNLIPEFKVKNSQTCSDLCSYIDSFHAFNNNLRCKKAHWNEKTHHCHLQRKNRQRKSPRNERKESPVFQAIKIKFYLPSFQNKPIDIVGIPLSRSEHASTKICKKICHAIESCQAINLVTSHQTGEFHCELLEYWNRLQRSFPCSSGQKCYFEHFHKSRQEVATKSRATKPDHVPDHFDFYISFN